MKKEINILQSGDIYFFHRPKVENNEREIQCFFIVLYPQNQSKYQLLVFLDYERAELLLITSRKGNLTEREKELNDCLEKIHSDNLLNEFAKIVSPTALFPIDE